MRRIQLGEVHKKKLEEYGIEGVFPDSCFGLQFLSGEEILREGRDIRWLYIIISGSAKVCRTAPNGKSLILCYCVSSGLIGEIELLTGEKTSCTTVKAITDFECIAVSYQACQAELKKNLFFSNMLGTVLASKLSVSSVNHSLLALCTGRQRLCTYILQNAHRSLFNDILTDVACSVGLSYRQVIRILRELCDEKILEKRESGYYILDPLGLKGQSYVFSD